MASIGIAASIQIRACSSKHITKKQLNSATTARSLETKQATNVVTPNVDGLKLARKQEIFPFRTSKEDGIQDSKNSGEPSQPRFRDERWKNGTWDLNMFVKQGKLDWEAVIVAEANRRRFLELYPEASSNEEPVRFRSSIIPWWAWIAHSHLPEAELLNGRAAIVGFFMAYIVDALTGLNMVGQTGNVVCKGALLLTIIGILLVQRKEDIQNIQKLADEATFYDKQWQASWQSADANNVVKEQSNKID